MGPVSPPITQALQRSGKVSLFKRGARQLVKNSLAPSTMITYTYAQSVYLKFYHWLHLNPLPATEDVLLLFIAGPLHTSRYIHICWLSGTCTSSRVWQPHVGLPQIGPGPQRSEVHQNKIEWNHYSTTT